MNKAYALALIMFLALPLHGQQEVTKPAPQKTPFWTKTKKIIAGATVTIAGILAIGNIAVRVASYERPPTCEKQLNQELAPVNSLELLDLAEKRFTDDRPDCDASVYKPIINAKKTELESTISRAQAQGGLPYLPGRDEVYISKVNDPQQIKLAIDAGAYVSVIHADENTALQQAVIGYDSAPAEESQNRLKIIELLLQKNAYVHSGYIQTSLRLYPELKALFTKYGYDYKGAKWITKVVKGQLVTTVYEPLKRVRY